MDVKDVYVLLTANTVQFEEKMAAAAAESDAMGKSFLGMSAGTALGVGMVAAAVVATGVELAKMGIEYEDSLAVIQERTGETVDQVNAIGTAFLNSSNDGQYSATDILKALGPVSDQLQTMDGAALSVQDSLTFMSGATDLATATGGKLTDTTASLATVMQTYGDKLGDTNQVSDELYNTSTATNTSISDIASTVDRLHAKLGPLAPSLEDVSSLMLDLTDHGVPAGRALLTAGTALESLYDPTSSAAQALSDLNIQAFDSNGKFVGLGTVFDQLNAKTSGMTDQQKLLTLSQIFGKGAAGDFFGTISGGSGALDTAKNKVDAVGTAHQAAGVQMDTVGGKWNTWMSEISNGANKTIGPFLDGAGKDLLDFFGTSLPGALDTATTDIAGFFGQMFNQEHVYVAKMQADIATITAGTHSSAPGTFGPGSPGYIPPSYGTPGGGGYLKYGTNAAGTDNWQGGLTTINEDGPELVNLPSGTQIIPASQTKAMLGSSKNGGSVTIGNVSITVQGSTDVKATALAVRDELLNIARGQGVLTQLGQYA